MFKGGGGEGGEGAESYDGGEKAWSSVNHSILSESTPLHVLMFVVFYISRGNRGMRWYSISFNKHNRR